MELLFLCETAAFAFFSWSLISILLNYNLARKIGFPVIISPVASLNPIWILTWRTFPSVLSLRHLPFGLGKWARCTYMGWPFDDKDALHKELGPIFTIVTPAGLEVTVADPHVTNAVFAKRKEFIKPAVMYDQLNVFGRNLNTVEGRDWERQRRLTAPNFNEKTSATVWDEAKRQANDMLGAWLEQGSQGTRDTVADTATLALHVLTRVGFGLTYSFHEGVRKVPPGHQMTYKEALSVCLGNIITFAIFPRRLLSEPLMPRALRRVGLAAHEFHLYMEEMLSHERTVSANSLAGSNNLVGALVRASDNQGQAQGRQSLTGPQSLTDEEIFGNIFAFNLAGHETTANTIASSLVLLAANPSYQSWLAEEIDQVWNSDPGHYEKTFPRLKRCLAVMYETLRLYGSIVFIPKSTGVHAQSVILGNKSYLLPPGTAVNINVQALHTDRDTWGEDALQWRPSRWIGDFKSPPSVVGAKSDQGAEHLINPENGTYIPWADGPRVCIGRKFSEVEFVAVIASLFSKARVRPVLQDKDNGKDGHRGLMKMVDESAIFAITLQMRNPRGIALMWEHR